MFEGLREAAKSTKLFFIDTDQLEIFLKNDNLLYEREETLKARASWLKKKMKEMKGRNHPWPDVSTLEHLVQECYSTVPSECLSTEPATKKRKLEVAVAVAV